MWSITRASMRSTIHSTVRHARARGGGAISPPPFATRPDTKPHTTPRAPKCTSATHRTSRSDVRRVAGRVGTDAERERCWGCERVLLCRPLDEAEQRGGVNHPCGLARRLPVGKPAARPRSDEPQPATDPALNQTLPLTGETWAAAASRMRLRTEPRKRPCTPWRSRSRWPSASTGSQCPSWRQGTQEATTARSCGTACAYLHRRIERRFVETEMAKETLDGPKGEGIRAQSPFGRVAQVRGHWVWVGVLPVCAARAVAPFRSTSTFFDFNVSVVLHYGVHAWQAFGSGGRGAIPGHSHVVLGCHHRREWCVVLAFVSNNKGTNTSWCSCRRVRVRASTKPWSNATCQELRGLHPVSFCNVHWEEEEEPQHAHACAQTGDYWSFSSRPARRI